MQAPTDERDIATCGRWTVGCWVLAVIAICVLAVGGCSRQFWRKQADKDVYGLVSEKACDQRWHVPRIDVTPDPRSRFYDTYDPDLAPLPPDDPAAGRYMLQVAGKRGYKSWHKFGRAFSIENPNWLDSFGLTQDFIQQASVNGEPSSTKDIPTIDDLTLAEAIELSYIHNRDYQTQIENVYLRALELSFERFQFAVRYLDIGGAEPGIDLEHQSTPHGPNDLLLNQSIGVRQLLPSGAQMAVELANNTVWMFSGPNQVNTASVISYSIVQPLLFAAGRKIALENLTQTERNVLYSVRDLARFRRLFFSNVVSGTGGFLSVLQQAQVVQNELDNIRRTRVQLDRLEAQISQVLVAYFEDLAALPEDVNEADLNNPRLSKYPTLVQQVAYDSVNKRLLWRSIMSPDQYATLLGMSKTPAWRAAVQKLRDQIVQRKIYEPLAQLPAGVTIPASIKDLLSYDAENKRLYWRWQSNEVAGRIQLISEEQAQIVLGLSNDANWQRAATALVNRLSVDARGLEILQLESRLRNSENRYRAQQAAYQNLLDRFKILLGLPPNLNVNIDLSMLEPFTLIDNRIFQMESRLNAFVSVWAQLDEDNPDEAQLRQVAQGLQSLRGEVGQNVLDLLRSDLLKLRKILPERLKRLETAEERGRVQQDIAQDEKLIQNLEQDFRRITLDLAALQKSLQPDEIQRRRAQFLAALGPVSGLVFYQNWKRQQADRIADLREALLRITRNAQRPQIGLRAEQIMLNDFTMSMEEAVEYALKHRLDLKNARASVMDARRQMEIAANRLQAVLNLRVEGDVRTPDDNKPFDFRGRESNFRVGIGFTAPLDLVNERNAYRDAQIAYQRARRAYMAAEDSVKQSVRQIWRDNALARQNFETARRQIRTSAAQFQLTAEQVFAPGEQRGNTGLNLLNALQSVLGAQNDLIQIWVDYETSRINIHRDMGIMEVDPQGLWTDSYYQGLAAGERIAPPKALPPPPAPHPSAWNHHERNATARRVRTVARGTLGDRLGRISDDAVAGRFRVRPDHWLTRVFDRSVFRLW